MTDQETETDAVAEFYFAHRVQIEEWAGLRTAARDVLHRCLASRVTELTALADDMTAVEAHLTSGPYPYLGLRRADWLLGTSSVAVCLGWTRGTMLSTAGTTWPYVGLRLQDPYDTDRELRRAFREALKPNAQDLGWTSSEDAWPWWRQVEAVEGESIDAFAGRCLHELQEAWRLISPAVEEHLRSASTEPPRV